MITKKTCNQFNKWLWKVESHPAAPGCVYDFNHLFSYSLQEVCKHGYSHWAGKDGIRIGYNKKNYEKYKYWFDKELRESGEEKLENIFYASVPYKKIFGEKWKADHVEYWGEMCFVVYRGKDFLKYHDVREWEMHAGPNSSGRSYEEVVINTCKKFIKCYGNFSDDDFLTKKEKANHKKESMFKSDRMTEDGKGHFLDRNPKYLHVNDAEINRRWLKWFAKSDISKKQWGDSFDSILKPGAKKNENRKTKKPKSR